MKNIAQSEVGKGRRRESFFFRDNPMFASGGRQWGKLEKEKKKYNKLGGKKSAAAITKGGRRGCRIYL